MLITLPKSALKYLDDKIIRIEVDDDLLKKNLKSKSVARAKILKKYNIDEAEYQKQIIEELER